MTPAVAGYFNPKAGNYEMPQRHIRRDTRTPAELVYVVYVYRVPLAFLSFAFVRCSYSIIQCRDYLFARSHRL